MDKVNTDHAKFIKYKKSGKYMDSSKKKVFIIKSDTQDGHYEVTSAEIAASSDIEYFLQTNKIPYLINDVHSAGRFIEYWLPDHFILQYDMWTGSCEFFNRTTGERLHYRES